MCPCVRVSCDNTLCRWTFACVALCLKVLILPPPLLSRYQDLRLRKLITEPQMLSALALGTRLPRALTLACIRWHPDEKTVACHGCRARYLAQTMDGSTVRAKRVPGALIRKAACIAVSPVAWRFDGAPRPMARMSLRSRWCALPTATPGPLTRMAPCGSVEIPPRARKTMARVS